MSSAGTIRAGKAYVEAGLDDSKLDKGLARAQAKLKSWGAAVKASGLRMLGVAIATALPLTLATKTFADFESGMVAVQNAANPTADELLRLRAAAMGLSKELNIGPAKVAAAMSELLKAGMSLENVLDGGAAAVVRFARVAEMEIPEAAVVVNDAMNVFIAEGLSAAQAADIISAAADSSSIAIRDVAMSFSMAGAVGAAANQTMRDMAVAIALLGQNGVKGSDAGTSLKTMLLRLQTGAESAGVVMRELGIDVRDSSGQMKPMRGIIEELQAKLAGLNAEARDQAMLKLFGTDAIRAGAILIGKGTEGWDAFAGKMGDALSVSDKYARLQGTLNGSMEKLAASAERAGVAFGAALAPALSQLADKLGAVAAWVEALISQNNGLALGVVKVTGTLLAFGAALTVVGGAMKFAGGAQLMSLVTMLGPQLTIATAAVIAGTTAVYGLADAWGLFGAKAETAAQAQERLNRILEAGRKIVDEGFQARLAAAGSDPDLLMEELASLHRMLDMQTKLNMEREQTRLATGDEQMADLIKRGREEEDRLRKSIGQVEAALKSSGKAAEQAGQQIAGAAEGAADANAAVHDRIRQAWQETAKLEGALGEIDIELSKLRAEGADEGLLDLLRIELERLDAVKARVAEEEKARDAADAMRSEAAGIAEQFRTPGERAHAALNRIAELASKIDTTTGNPFLGADAANRARAAALEEARAAMAAPFEERRQKLIAGAEAAREQARMPLTPMDAFGREGLAFLAAGLRSSGAGDQQLRAMERNNDLMGRALAALLRIDRNTAEGDQTFDLLGGPSGGPPGAGDFTSLIGG